MDYRELNVNVDMYTADDDICTSNLREWRWQELNIALLDLWSTYLQMHLNELFWPYQTVVFQDRRYCLKRLGFGLNVALQIMKSIVNTTRLRDDQIKTTSAYINDLYMNEDVTSITGIIDHLSYYELASKAPKQPKDGV